MEITKKKKKKKRKKGKQTHNKIKTKIMDEQRCQKEIAQLRNKRRTNLIDKEIQIDKNC